MGDFRSSLPPPLVSLEGPGRSPLEHVHTVSLLTCVLCRFETENLHRRGAERQADQEGSEGSAQTGQAGGAQETT